jgi:toxin-antitoxin system PIN domain toxin
MIAIDTNVLVYAHRAKAPQHASAKRAIQRAADSGRWGFALASVSEFWSVVTHPSSVRPSTANEARRFLESLERAGAEVWVPGAGLAGRLAHIAAERGVGGPRIFDLQIALTAFEGGATELWTTDAQFVRVVGLRVVNPLSG